MKFFIYLISIVILSQICISIQLKTKTKTNTHNKIIFQNNNLENLESADSFLSPDEEENDLVDDNSNKSDNNNISDSSKETEVSNKADAYKKENNNNILNFVQETVNPKIRRKQINLLVKEKSNTDYAYKKQDHSEETQNSIHKGQLISHSNQVVNKLVKRNIHTSIPEKIEGSFKRYRRQSDDDGDDFTAFLGYLDYASDKAILKMKLQRKIQEEGHIPQKVGKN
mmetsp:Transcript_25465/g.26538  ORF Transcript_25465/g.26538 Transcript_25465/m.26538 type:complete len:226 (+) Transcript_25465:3-680(+)